jgi:hypothetical protein
VAVRVLLDGVGSLKVPDDHFKELIAAGGGSQVPHAKFGALTRFIAATTAVRSS